MSLIIFLTCATFLPRLADAQGAAAFDPLSVPAATILCRSIPTIPKDSAALELEFVDGTDPFGHRVSRVFFDSVGTPRYMIVLAPWTPSDSEVRIYTLVVQFHPKRLGGSVISPLTFGSASSAAGVDSVKRASRIKEDLTEAAISHAEALAQSYWDHRCNEPFPDQ